MDSRVLLVHRDPGIVRALESGLRSEGFEVETAPTGSEGLRIFQTTLPGLVMTDVAVGEPDGFAFVSRLRQSPTGKTAAVILVDTSLAVGRRQQAIQAGADCRLTGRDLTKEVMTRARLLFGSPRREATSGASMAPRGFACDLADLDVLDLVALIQRNGRSGVGILSAPGRVPGSLYFDQGRLIDAQAGHASGLEAFHRLACWTSGALNLEWRNFRRRDILGRSPGDLVTSGLTYVEEWTLLLERLGTPNTVFRVDLDALIDHLSSTFGQLTEVLNACDGMRSVVQIVDECGISALDVLKSMIQLRNEGLISDPGQFAQPERIRQDLEATLMGGGDVAQLPVTRLAPRVPRPLAPRADSPPGGGRLTVPMGQAGLPVSVADAKKVPAVTMQFPRSQVTAEALPPPAQPEQPSQSQNAGSLPVQSEALQTRPIASRALPARRQTPQAEVPLTLASAPTEAPQQEPASPRDHASDRPQDPAQDPTKAPNQDPTHLSAPATQSQPSAAPSLTVAGFQPIVRVIKTDDARPEPPAPSAAAAPDGEPRRPWWDRRNGERPPRPAEVSSNAQSDPVWPKAAPMATEPATARAKGEREAAASAVESPTVYLPARPAEGRPAAARSPASRRPAPHPEGIRQKSRDRKKTAPAPRNKAPLWQRHQSLLLAIAASVLLGALVAIGVAVVRSLR